MNKFDTSKLSRITRKSKIVEVVHEYELFTVVLCACPMCGYLPTITFLRRIEPTYDTQENVAFKFCCELECFDPIKMTYAKNYGDFEFISKKSVSNWNSLVNETWFSFNKLMDSLS